jgi:hypothetical protein
MIIDSGGTISGRFFFEQQLVVEMPPATGL